MKKLPVATGLWLISILCFADVPATEIRREKVLSDPEWQQKYDSYAPDSEKISILKSRLREDLRIDVYLGLWCPDSRNNVPPFLKIIDAAGVRVPVRFFSVPRKPVKTIKYYVDAFQVERIPTFIFYQKDKEIGRIVENPKASLEEDALAILSP